ncbi:MAG: UDP-2,3-diacylglucosamine diphosphatase LpxI [Filomicrobium sp.]
MRRPPARRIGLLAGGKSLPIEIADSLIARGVPVHVVALEGEAGEDIERFSPTWVNWGQIGKIIASFKKAQCEKIVIAGSVNRPDLSAIKPDFGLLRAIPTVLRLMRVGGDDAILRGVVAYLKSFGLEIIGVSEIAPELLVAPGVFAGPSESLMDHGDIGLGFEVLEALARFDVGQAVVTSAGQVVAIEAAEGTDRMLERLTARRHLLLRDGKTVARGFLIKAPKAGQDLRVDLPAIGPQTVRAVAAADLNGIAVEGKRVLALERSSLSAMAETHRVSVVGFEKDDQRVTRGKRTVADRASGEDAQSIRLEGIRRLGRCRMPKAAWNDVMRGAGVITALETYGVGQAVIVARRHVLAVEAGEGVADAVARASSLRQWGKGFWSRRIGVAVFSAGRDLTPEIVSQVADAGMAGICVVLRKFSASVRSDIIEEADRRKLFIVGLE